MPGATSNDDEKLLTIIKRWREGIASAVSAFNSHVWPTLDPHLYDDTACLSGAIIAKYPKLDPTPLQDITNEIVKWCGNDRDDPPPGLLDRMKARAIMRLDALQMAVTQTGDGTGTAPMKGEPDKSLPLEDWLWQLDKIKEELARLIPERNIHALFTLRIGNTSWAPRDFVSRDWWQPVSSAELAFAGCGDRKTSDMYLDFGGRAMPFVFHWGVGGFYDGLGVGEGWDIQDAMPANARVDNVEGFVFYDTITCCPCTCLKGQHPPSDEWKALYLNLMDAIAQAYTLAPEIVLNKIGNVAALPEWILVLFYLSLKRCHPVIRSWGNTGPTRPSGHTVVELETDTPRAPRADKKKGGDPLTGDEYRRGIVEPLQSLERNGYVRRIGTSYALTELGQLAQSRLFDERVNPGALPLPDITPEGQRARRERLRQSSSSASHASTAADFKDYIINIDPDFRTATECAFDYFRQIAEAETEDTADVQPPARADAGGTADFTIDGGVVLYRGHDIGLPAQTAETVRVFEMLWKNVGHWVASKDFPIRCPTSGSQASANLRDRIRKIKHALKSSRIPYDVANKRGLGYMLRPTDKPA